MSEFYRHPHMGDGHLNKCKFCAKLDVRLNRAKRADYYITHDRERSGRPERKDQYRRKRIAYRALHPERTAVYCRVHRAKKAGVLVPPIRCPGCGEVSRVDAHHEDYSRPLQVTWICPRCHHAHHHVCNYFTGQTVA
jgi:hypothetical protein